MYPSHSWVNELNVTYDCNYSLLLMNFFFLSRRASLTPSPGKQVHSTCLPSHIPTSAALYSLYFAQEERPTCLSVGTFTPALVITLTVLVKCTHLGSVHSIITTAIIVPARCWHFGDSSVCKTVTAQISWCSWFWGTAHLWSENQTKVVLKKGGHCSFWSVGRCFVA